MSCGDGRSRLAAALLAATTVAACSMPPDPPPPPAHVALEVADPAEVDAVVFLVGDMGYTYRGRSPALVQLQRDVEYWSKALAEDSAVSVVFLGDNVYEVGVRDADHPEFPTDTMRLWNQIRVVGGPAAMEHATAGWFLAGNHDWGDKRGEEGLARVGNQEVELDRARATGPRVTLLPAAGVPGPVVRDLRQNVRIVFIDTHWFLQARAEDDKKRFFDELEAALRGAGERDVIVVAHHPWDTAGPHGVGGRGAGIPFLLERSGTLVQDLNSPVYREFLRRFRFRVKAVGRSPLVFAAGHDHSLQVLAGTSEHDPEHVLVSGAGSKLSPVSDVPGLRYAASRPGYMMLVFRNDHEVDLFVAAGSPEHLLCPGSTPERDECMREGVDAFETAYARVLREPLE